MASSEAKKPIIRPVAQGDLHCLYEIASHPDVARNMLLLPSMEFSETEAWFENRQQGHHRLVAEHDGRVIGSASLVQNLRPRLQHSARVGLMVHPNAWNQGVGRALMQAIVGLADRWLNVRRLELGVLVHNATARHLYESLDFVLEGTRRDAVFGDGGYQDEQIMARLHNAPPVPEMDSGPRFPRRADVVGITTRTMRSEDAEALHGISSHPAVARGTLQMPSMELSAAQRRTDSGGPGLYRYTAVVQHQDGSRRVVGNATLHQSQNPRLIHGASLGLAVHPDYWGIGVGSRLLATLLDLADNWLALHRVELDVFAGNEAGIRLYERAGFEREGLRRAHAFGDGRWNNSYFMARLRP